MSIVYDYLLAEKNKGEKAPYSVIATLLFSLSALEECYKHHPDLNYLETLIDDTTFHYVQANNWIPYRKRKIATKTGCSIHMVKKEIQQLVEAGKLIVHTLPNDTFLEVFDETINSEE